jgi:tetratricopeptide (TPR) repeat protein
MIRNTYLTSILYAIFLFAFVNTIHAEDLTKETFQQGNEAYQSGDYLKAIEYYNQIIDNGYKTPELFYNLGNAYYKLKNIPNAILNYERALKLAPDDEDIQFNIRLANLQTLDKIEPLPKVFYQEWWESLSGWHSSGTWSVLMVIFIWLTFIGLAGFLLLYSPFKRKISFFILILSFVFAVLSYIFAETNYAEETSKDSAIIFSESVYVKSSPDAESTDLFILHEGTKVEVLDEVGTWSKIKLANGNVGWLPQNTIEII